MSVRDEKAGCSVVGLGAGGHARVILDMLKARPDIRVVCLLDADRTKWGTRLCGVPIEGGDEELARLRKSGVTHGFSGVGAYLDAACRRRVYERLCGAGLEPLSVRHSFACVADDVRAGAGLIVMAGGIINPDVVLGDNVVINTGVIVEHSCRIGSHVMVAPGAVLCGEVQVEEGVFVGAGAVVKEGVRLGAGCVIGAGSVVLHDVPPGIRVAGVPARKLHP